jgi:hypothetical protein
MPHSKNVGVDFTIWRCNVDDFQHVILFDVLGLWMWPASDPEEKFKIPKMDG